MALQLQFRLLTNRLPGNAAHQLDGLICRLQVLQKQFATTEVPLYKYSTTQFFDLYLLKFKFNITPEAIYYLSQWREKKKICSTSEFLSTWSHLYSHNSEHFWWHCHSPGIVSTNEDTTGTRQTQKHVSLKLQGHLTWTKARSCFLHSSHQTLWTSSSCTHESSHISQRWCSEQLLAFPILRLKTVERDWDRWNRLKAQNRVMMYCRGLQEIACNYACPVAVKGFTHYLNDYSIR